MEEFETARRVLSNSSQMLRPFDPELKMGLVVDTAKTTGLGYILFQLDPCFPPASEVPEGQELRAGPMNFSLQGVWSVRRQGLLGQLIPHRIGGGGILACFTTVALSHHRGAGRVRFRGPQAIRGAVYEEADL